MRGEQAIFNLEIKKKSGLSINPDIHHSKVFSSGYIKDVGYMKQDTGDRIEDISKCIILVDERYIRQGTEYIKNL